jgi:hypothetical protein
MRQLIYTKINLSNIQFIDGMEEGESGEDLDNGGGGRVEGAVGEALAWIRRRWRWRSVEVDMEEERARNVNSTTVKEAVDEVPTWTQRRSGRQSARTRLLWRWPRSGQACEWQQNNTNMVRV